MDAFWFLPGLLALVVSLAAIFGANLGVAPLLLRVSVVSIAWGGISG